MRRWNRRTSSGAPGRWLLGSATLALACTLLLTACSGPSTLDAYSDDIDRLERRIAQNPQDGAAFRDLGVIYLRADRPTEAYAHLKDAYARTPGDPKTIFYLALASEGVGKQKSARDLYAQFGEVSTESRYRTLMMGRYVWLMRQDARSDIRERMAADDRIDQRPVSDRTVAVLPFVFRDGSGTYDALGRGLAEAITDDLTHIGGLQPVERVHLQALLNEMSLQEQTVTNPDRIPQVGRLLGAGQLVGGGYRVEETGQGATVHLDVQMTRVEQNASSDLGARSGTMEDLFRIQSELVLQMAQAMNVQVTERERRAVASPPTKNVNAFLAYSRGLQAEDRGEFETAAQHYRRAHQLDSTFEAPAQRRERAEGLSAVAGSRHNALGAAVEAETTASAARRTTMR